MSMEKQGAYILEERELAVLLQAKGISGFQGFPLRDIPGTEEEILQVLWSLTQKEFLSSDGLEFQADKGIADCLGILEKAKGMFLLIPKQEECPESFCYPGEQVLICQPAAFKPGTVKMWRTDWENLEELIEDGGRETEIWYYEAGSPKAGRRIRAVRKPEGCFLEDLDNRECMSVVSPGDMGGVLKSLVKDVET